jgi:hypothetical protein
VQVCPDENAVIRQKKPRLTAARQVKKKEAGGDERKSGSDESKSASSSGQVCPKSDPEKAPSGQTEQGVESVQVCPDENAVIREKKPHVTTVRRQSVQEAPHG